MKLLTEIREALIERIFRRRLQERWDKWFLAGIDTAYEAIKLAPDDSPYDQDDCEFAIEEAREGFLEEVESR
jgi:ribosomal protein L16 Arg81 hydroxylase